VLLYPGEPGPDPLYLMYRGTGLLKDRRAMEDAGLRYDITVIYPGKIGSEYVKTLRSLPSESPGPPLDLSRGLPGPPRQSPLPLAAGGEVSGQVDDFVVADFAEGDILLIPPFYGHVTVNPGDVPLVLANWIARDFQSVYDPVRLRKGLAFYDVEYKGQSIFMPNDSYGEHPKPRLISPETTRRSDSGREKACTKHGRKAPVLASW
jgi:glucose-6-phosphate isomerase